MLRLILVVAFISVLPALSNAADVATIATAPSVAMVSSDKTLTGSVKSVSVADAAKGTKSQIMVTGADTKTTDILVKETTTLYGADAKAIALDKIATDTKVEVVYSVSKEGVNEAKSIKVVK